MRVICLLLTLCCWVQSASGQAEPSAIVQPWSRIVVTAGYAPTSEHIFLGQNDQRKLAELEVGYRRFLIGNAYAQWSWEIDVQPVILMTEPLAHDTLTFANGFIQEGGSVRVPRCDSSRSTVSVANPAGPPVTAVAVRTCGSLTDRGFGLSPLGQHVRLLPFHRVGPFVQTNAGFIAFNRNVPSDLGRRFNFEFGGGAGLEFALPHRRMMALEYRIHHISNAYTAPDNSGIDQQMFRISYSFAR